MDVKRCDRCGKIYTENPKIPAIKIKDMDAEDILTRVSISYEKDGRPYNDSCYLDLCKGCLDKFLDFMDCRSNDSDFYSRNNFKNFVGKKVRITEIDDIVIEGIVKEYIHVGKLKICAPNNIVGRFNSPDYEISVNVADIQIIEVLE